MEDIDYVDLRCNNSGDIGWVSEIAWKACGLFSKFSKRNRDVGLGDVSQGQRCKLAGGRIGAAGGRE